MQKQSTLFNAGHDEGPAGWRFKWLSRLNALLLLVPPALLCGWLLLFSRAPWVERLALSAVLLVCLLASATVAFLTGTRRGSDEPVVRTKDSPALDELTARGGHHPDATETGTPTLADTEDRMRQHTEAFAKASHELRTPLNAIIGYSELIQRTESDGAANPAKRMDYVRNIEMAGRHMLDVVTGVLDFSQLEAGAYVLSITDIELGDTCSAALRLVNHEAGEKGIALWCEVPPDLPKIQADKRAVMQMLLNLLGNAVKFSSEGDAVTVRAWQDGDMVRIAVSDTGPGIPDDEIIEIKQSFRRASNTRGTTIGHGLGLAVTANLVELHGGSLSAANALGGGAEFVITLPIRQKDILEEEDIQAVA